MSGKTADTRVLEVGRGACRGVRATRSIVLTVRAGHAWVTVERDTADYWLAPGDALPLAAGERVWVSGWDGAVRCELAPLAQPEDGGLAALRAWTMRWIGAPLCAWWAGRHGRRGSARA